MDGHKCAIDVNRRSFMKNFGAAGLTTLASVTQSMLPAMEKVRKSEFDYPFKKFRPDQSLRVGMIGVDGHTGMIVEDLAKVKGARLTAYAHYNDTMANRFKEARLYRNYEEMLEKEELDVVGICMPLYLNAKTAIAVAKKGIHVIVEKPVAITLDDLKSLKKTVIENKVRLTTLLGMRLTPPFMAIHEAIAQGRIGEPILATAQKSYKWGARRPEFYKKHKTYGGTIPWIGIHAIDYIHFTTKQDFTEVTAFQGNKDHPEYPGCQDYAGVLMRMGNNGTAMLNLDYLRPQTAPSHGDDRLRVIGSEGVLEIRDLGEKVELISSDTKSTDLPLPEGKTLFEDFAAELRGEGTHIHSPEEPFEMTRVALLAHQAAERGEMIKL